MKKLYWFIIGLLISFLIIPFTVNVEAQPTDLNYVFNENILYDVSNPNYNSTLNIRNQTDFTRTFNATYSFTNEADGTSGVAIDFVDVDNSDASCTAQIIASEGSHNKVLELYDNNGAGATNIGNTLAGVQTLGTIEFWLRTDDATFSNVMVFSDGGTNLFRFRIDDDKFQYNDGGWNDVGVTASDGRWYHISINFECTASGYMGLAQYDWNVNINGEGYGDYGFDNNQPHLDTLSLNTGTGDSNYYGYYDAIGYLWDVDYSINDNIIPYNTVNSTTEIDKWEFFNNENATLTTNGQQNIPYFTELNAIAYITKNQEQSIDETAVYIPIAGITHEGIERSIDNVDGEVREIVFRVAKGGNSAVKTLYEYFDIDSYDDTLICRLRIDDVASSGDLRLSYYDGGSYIQLEDIDDSFWIYTFNITIISNIVVLVVNSTTTYYFSTIAEKDGIGDVKVECFLSDASIAQTGLFVDSIGVYVDGISETNDYGSILYYIGIDYNPKTQNLFSFSGTGFLGVSLTSFEISPQTVDIFPFQNATDFSFMNSYHLSSTVVENSFLVAIVNATDNFNINSVFIRGVKLSLGVNDIIPTYTYGNIDLNNSYYYVASNVLRNILVIDQDGATEYIQINFDITNVLAVNRSVGFNCFYNGYGFSEFRVVYTDTTSNIYSIGSYSQSINEVQPQSKVVDAFTHVISDNNDNSFTNTVSQGYIRSLRLRYIPNIDVTILTINLLALVIPLLIMLIPTFAIAGLYGKDAIIPMLILMSIVCFATALIPAWIFFVMVFGFGVILFMQRRGDMR